MITQFYIFNAQQASELSRENSARFAKDYSLASVSALDLLSTKQAAFEFSENKLSLNLNLDERITQLSFDFSDGEVGFRAARVSKSNEVVAKAIGCKPHYRPKVLDATAGMGRDSLIMAALGCEVTMHERNFAIYQLLQNALDDFKKTEDYRQLPGQLNLSNIDSAKALLTESIDVIYLDPMFPERKKSALVKKEMRLFKLLAGEDQDADELFDWALHQPVKRLVVKRPKGAPLLGSRKPSHEIKAKKFRYDVYILGV